MSRNQKMSSKRKQLAAPYVDRNALYETVENHQMLSRSPAGKALMAKGGVPPNLMRRLVMAQMSKDKREGRFGPVKHDPNGPDPLFPVPIKQEVYSPPSSPVRQRPSPIVVPARQMKPEYVPEAAFSPVSIDYSSSSSSPSMSTPSPTSCMAWKRPPAIVVPVHPFKREYVPASAYSPESLGYSSNESSPTQGSDGVLSSPGSSPGRLSRQAANGTYHFRRGAEPGSMLDLRNQRDYYYANLRGHMLELLIDTAPTFPKWLVVNEILFLCDHPFGERSFDSHAELLQEVWLRAKYIPPSRPTIVVQGMREVWMCAVQRVNFIGRGVLADMISNFCVWSYYSKVDYDPDGTDSQIGSTKFLEDGHGWGPRHYDGANDPVFRHFRDLLLGCNMESRVIVDEILFYCEPLSSRGVSPLEQRVELGYRSPFLPRRIDTLPTLEMRTFWTHALRMAPAIGIDAFARMVSTFCDGSVYTQAHL